MINEEEAFGKEYFIQYSKMCNFVDILAYSDHNYIYNFNDGDDHNRYVNHDMLTQEESMIYLDELGEKGYPEIIIGNPEIIGFLGLDTTEYMYYPIYNFTCRRINKYNALYASSFVYAREDVFFSRKDWPIFQQ